MASMIRTGLVFKNFFPEFPTRNSNKLNVLPIIMWSVIFFIRKDLRIPKPLLLVILRSYHVFNTHLTRKTSDMTDFIKRVF